MKYAASAFTAMAMLFLIVFFGVWAGEEAFLANHPTPAVLPPTPAPVTPTPAVLPPTPAPATPTPAPTQEFTGGPPVGLDSEAQTRKDSFLDLQKAACNKKRVLSGGRTLFSCKDTSAKVYDLAKIANAVYILDEPDHSETALNKDTGEYKVIPESIVNKEDAIKMAVWKNAGNGHTVLSIKGTSNFNDVKEDLALMFGPGSAARAEAVKSKARELKQKFGVNLITGHSLGAYHTEIVATNEGIPGIAFCAPGTNEPLGLHSFGGKKTLGFRNVNFNHDLLGNPASGLYSHVQWSIYVYNPSYTPTHSILGMIAYFSNKQEITNWNILDYTSNHLNGYYLPDDWAGTCYKGNSC